MQILHTIRSVNPQGGGPIEAVRQLSGMMEAQGHSVEVLSLDAPADPWVREFPHKLTALGPARWKFGFNAQLPRWLAGRSIRHDAIVVNGIWQYHSFGTWRALRHSTTPYFVFPHGMLDPWFKRAHPLKHL